LEAGQFFKKFCALNWTKQKVFSVEIASLNEGNFSVKCPCYLIIWRVPFAQDCGALVFDVVQGEWSGYPFLVLVPKAFGPVGYPLLSLPEVLRARVGVENGFLHFN
jgi:hypothetical protein